ncbi:DUF5702 domain-containing protein [Anaerosporobacter faecicola]|uniref:DUF5702 domain-containing protein n=1 Tax=Anaerosporobacter faecicola TaxID=2718714 RepID=UPI00143AE963|nr:DUF5702 domain-containing protein [Anaerosporobacter faecicola]
MHYKKSLGGSITVYLSLVLLLVTAILCTVVEGARLQGAKNLGQSMLQASVDSLYSSYQRELFDTYGIFAYSCTNDNLMVEEELEAVVQKNFVKSVETKNWLEDQIEQKDVLSKVFQYMDLYELQLDQVEIQDIAMLTDYQGELFLNQVYAYMKYSAPANLIKDTLERWNLYDSTEETTKVMKKKLETQESLGELSKLMLQLIEEVEGVDTDENGVRFNKSGVLKTKDSFAKKIVSQPPSMQTVGINKELVFYSLKEKYYNISNKLDLQIHCAQDAIACNKRIEELEKSLADLEAERSKLESAIANKEQEESVVEDEEEGEEQDTVSEEEEQLAHIEEEIESKNQERKTQVEKKEQRIKEKKQLQKEMLQKINDTISKIEKAQKTINKIESKSEELGSKVDEYEQVIEAEKSELTTENYEEFQNSKKQMREYLGQQNNPDTISATSAVQMRKVLQKNQDLLESIYKNSDQVQKDDTNSLEQDINQLQQCKAYAASYNVENLRFDYSSLQVEEEVESPVDSVGTLLESGLLALVVEDSSVISEQTIDKAHLPSTTANIKEDEQEADCKRIIDECEDNEYSTQVTDSFSADHSAVTNLTEKLLLNQYQIDFFKNYVQTVKESEANKEGNSNKEENSNNSKSLEYEQEYILAGHNCDKDNLSSVVTKIVMMRTVLNFLYLFTDKEKNAAAYTTATSLVGFTCLPPLITLVKIVILFAWAMVEALVDTYALLAGYSVPIFKTKSTYQVHYKDLLTMSKAKIGTLAKNFEKTTSKIGNLSYEQYIRIFLLLSDKKKNCFRTMDLIQINMQGIIGNTFQLEHCVFGIKVHAVMSIPEKFITFPFVKDILGKTEGGYVVETTISNGY